MAPARLIFKEGDAESVDVFSLNFLSRSPNLRGICYISYSKALLLSRCFPFCVYPRIVLSITCAYHSD